MFELKNIESLLKIFSIEKKSDLVKYCKETLIHQSDFAGLVFACEGDQMPWRHKISYRDFVPTHLTPKGNLGSLLARNGVGTLNPDAKKEMRKISQLFLDRRYLVGHIFYTSDLKFWQFFYFDQRDIEQRSNHWEHGSHIHLLNHLWPNLDAETLWNSFNSGNPKLSGALHIRFQASHRDI